MRDVGLSIIFGQVSYGLRAVGMLQCIVAVVIVSVSAYALNILISYRRFESYTSTLLRLQLRVATGS